MIHLLSWKTGTITKYTHQLMRSKTSQTNVFPEKAGAMILLMQIGTERNANYGRR